ncbi:MAG: hypothetical protein K5694_04435 [Bacilli bacterium]|nr:hypothetical protein [Bacilli bacterium]
MQSRMEKYFNYRLEIKNTPDHKFPNSNLAKIKLSDEEKEVNTGYLLFQRYKKKKHLAFLFKTLALVIVIMIMIVAYFLWVKG